MLESLVSKFQRKRARRKLERIEARSKQCKWMLRHDLFPWIGNCIRRGRDFKTRLIVPHLTDLHFDMGYTFRTRLRPRGVALPSNPTRIACARVFLVIVSLLPLLAQKDELISGCYKASAKPNSSLIKFPPLTRKNRFVGYCRQIFPRVPIPLAANLPTHGLVSVRDLNKVRTLAARFAHQSA